MSAYKHFNACYYCKPPRRHPGCHATCPDYAEDKKNYDAIKANAEFERQMNDAMHTPGFYQTLKRKRNREKR